MVLFLRFHGVAKIEKPSLERKGRHFIGDILYFKSYEINLSGLLTTKKATCVRTS